MSHLDSLAGLDSMVLHINSPSRTVTTSPIALDGEPYILVPRKKRKSARAGRKPLADKTPATNLLTVCFIHFLKLHTARWYVYIHRVNLIPSLLVFMDLIFRYQFHWTAFRKVQRAEETQLSEVRLSIPSQQLRLVHPYTLHSLKPHSTLVPVLYQNHTLLVAHLRPLSLHPSFRKHRALQNFPQKPSRISRQIQIFTMNHSSYLHSSIRIVRMYHGGHQYGAKFYGLEFLIRIFLSNPMITLDRCREVVQELLSPQRPNLSRLLLRRAGVGLDGH